MKIFSADQIRSADKITIERQGISSDLLMERASGMATSWLREHFASERPVLIFCGNGNNGGDGLAIGRMLDDAGYQVQVCVLPYLKDGSADFHLNLQRLKKTSASLLVLKEGELFSEIPEKALVVDAIFGTGLNRAPSEWIGRQIQLINASGARVVAVDMPSGLYADRPATHTDRIIKASVTLSFQFPKLSFLLPETAPYAGHWVLLDIGIDQDYIRETETPFSLTGRSYWGEHYRGRAKFDHKGKFGHLLIAGGSRGKIGAVQLSAKAALRSGSGLVTVCVPSCGGNILQIAVPEAMTIEDPLEDHLSLSPDTSVYASLVIGPGMGMHPDTGAFLKAVLQQYHQPVVLDADALNLVGSSPELWEFIPKGSVLTPHPGELKRLIGEWEDDFDKLERVASCCLRYQVCMVVKGAHSLITDGRVFHFNQSGNPGMATAGSGDVLSGIVGSLLGQGYSGLEAATMAVYLHGLAGDLCVEGGSEESLIAGDLISHLGAAFKSLSGESKPWTL